MKSRFESKEQELRRSINRLVFLICVPAGLVSGISLVALRWNGSLPLEEYTYQQIIIQAGAIGILLPVCMATMFWLMFLPKSQIWFERLGALIVFAGFSIMILMAIVRFFC